MASAIKTIAMIPPSELKVAIAAMLPTRLRSATSGETVLVALEVLVVVLLVDVVDVLDVLEELVELVVSDEVVLVSDDVVSEEVVSLEVVSEEVSELVSEVLSAVVSAVVSALVSAVVAVSAVSVASVAVSESSVESPESSVESARFCLTSVVHVGALLGGGVGSGMLTVRGRAWAGVCAGWSAHASRQRVCRARRIDNFIFIFFWSCSFLLLNLFSLAKSEALRNEGKKSSREEKNNEAERSLSLQPFRVRHETRTNQRGHSTANCSNG